jgi:hypothetical protein
VRADTGSDTDDRASDTRSARFCWVLLFISAMTLIAFFTQVHADRAGSPHLTGSWEGFDPAGERVIYHFDEGGGGYRFAAGLRDLLDYEFAPGYPNRITIHFRDSAGGPPQQGLLRVVTSARIQLDLGRPGDPAPSQLSTDALDLRRPPVR